MALASRLFDELNSYYMRPWPTQIPSYLKAFDGMDAFEKTETGYSMEVMVPGFSKEDLIVQIVNDRYLTVNGESSYGTTKRKFAQRWHLPIHVDISTIKATVKKGILTVIMNKKEPVIPRSSVHPIVVE